MIHPTNKWEALDAHLLQVLYVLLTEKSVSNAAKRLNQSQPAISTALKKLREITGDQLLVRSRNGMTPTERGLSLLEPVSQVLSQLELIATQQVNFDPAQSRQVFNLAASDYLNPIAIGEILRRIHVEAPHCTVIMHSMGHNVDYAHALESGMYDAVIGNWPQPPEYLRLAPLFEDEVVCLMRKLHPLANKPLSMDDYLNADHIAPTPYTVGQRGVIDLHLSKERLKRNIVAFIPYFGMIPYMLLQLDAIFSAPRSFSRHYSALLPLTISTAPIQFPKISYYLLWHERQHRSPEFRWFRDLVISVLRNDSHVVH